MVQYTNHLPQPQAPSDGLPLSQLQPPLLQMSQKQLSQNSLFHHDGMGLPQSTSHQLWNSLKINLAQDAFGPRLSQAFKMMYLQISQGDGLQTMGYGFFHETGNL
jgi:hypothetical protein